jgi:hypothetical protein
MSDIRDLVRICGIDGAHVVDRAAFVRFLADVQGRYDI